MVLTVVAFFAILVTGRYPRPIFDFNVGVLRWSWRVAFYSYSALGTDRYPPFTLADVPDYPARLEVDYPKQLSRGLVLVKWWLLALPHYLIVGVFVGGAVAGVNAASDDGGWSSGGGLIGLLVLIAGIVLLFTGRYPRGIFDFVMGMNRWCYRVAAYAFSDDRRVPALPPGHGRPGNGARLRRDRRRQPQAGAWAPMTRAARVGAVCWVVAAVASLLLGAVTASSAAATPPDRAALARMDRVIHDGMERSGVPGFAVAVVSGNDVVHARGFGDAGEDRPVTPQTPFLLGSASKSFTALAAMQLVDAGRLDLDAPARQYVPEFQLADQRAADRITVRQVLQQTTGLPATAGGPIVRSAADGTALAALRELHGATLATPPGAAFAYANANYVLAGLIIERASGEPYPQYVQRHIFTPLGMRDSYVALDAAKRGGLATGHRYWFGLSTTHGPTFRAGIQSAGYLMSSAQDMGRYLAMYLNHGVTADGDRIVSRRGLATMLAPGRPGRMGAWSDHADARYAMGWYVGGPWSEPAQLHPGRAPDSSAMIVMFPHRALAVVTLTNAANDLTLPGYPAPVDRVERNAVDVLIGDPVDTGTSLHRYYLYLDLIALALLAAMAWAIVRAVRALRTRTRPGPPMARHRRGRDARGRGRPARGAARADLRVAGLVPLATRCVHRHRPHRRPAVGQRCVAPRPARARLP